MNKVIFITGTDTNVGKTYCGVRILQEYHSQGLSTVGLKPVASGSEKDQTGQLKNDDALKLQATASIKLPYFQVNPFVFEPPIAPHIAASLVGTSLTAQALLDATLSTIKQYSADITVIEGAGGWFLPLNDQETMVDYLALLSREVHLEIVLIVGMKLGCLNHALLTVNAIESFTQKHPAKFQQWIPNSPEGEMLYLKENIEFLSNSVLSQILRR